MGRQKSSQTIRCRYYTWKLFRRGTIYYADGRSNATNLGKHTLSARTEEKALQSLHRLDEKMARNAGLIPRDPKVSTVASEEKPINITDGWAKYLEHVDNAVVSGMDFSETEIMDWVGHRSSAMVHHYRHQRPGASQQRMCSISFIADDTVSPAN